MEDYLQKLLDLQDALQVKAYGGSPREFFDDRSPNENIAEGIWFLSWNVLALEDELHELLGETSWKPWAKGDFIDISAAKGEAIDALHFLLNIFIAFDMSAEEIMYRYADKRQKNIKRQEEDYDGRSTKCPGCRRALDDTAVGCRRGQKFDIAQGEFIPGVHCVYPGKAEFYPDGT